MVSEWVLLRIKLFLWVDLRSFTTSSLDNSGFPHDDFLSALEAFPIEEGFIGDLSSIGDLGDVVRHILERRHSFSIQMKVLLLPKTGGDVSASSA